MLIGNNLFVINNRRINTVSDLSSILGQSGPVQFTWYYTFAMHQVLWPADYLVLSGALGKPCTRVMYSLDYLAIVYLSCILLDLVLSNTVDQTVSTVLVQLGAARHLY